MTRSLESGSTVEWVISDLDSCPCAGTFEVDGLVNFWTGSFGPHPKAIIIARETMTAQIRDMLADSQEVIGRAEHILTGRRSRLEINFVDNVVQLTE